MRALAVGLNAMASSLDNSDVVQQPQTLTIAGELQQTAVVGFDEEESDDQAQAQTELPPPPPTSGAAATVHALATAGVELDADGLPWDQRIHSSMKTKLANNTWKLARNIDKAYVEQCRAEARQNMSAPITMAPTTLAAIPPAAAQQPVADNPAPAQLAPFAQDQKPTNPGLLFTATIQKYAEAEKAQKIAPGSGDAWAKQAGLVNMASLITRPDLCGQFYDQLVAIMGA